jgi:hypothetical protein
MQFAAKMTKNWNLNVRKKTELIVMQKKKANCWRNNGMWRATQVCKTLRLGKTIESLKFQTTLTNVRSLKFYGIDDHPILGLNLDLI